MIEAWAWDQDVPTKVDLLAYLDALRRDPCAYCSALAAVPAGNARDHIEPKSRGGSDDWENLATACHGCNSRKGVFTLLGFLGRAQAKAHLEEQIRRWRALSTGATG